MHPVLRKILYPAFLLLNLALVDVAAGETLFELRRIEVSGNTLLSEYQVLETTTPFLGKDKGFRDIQQALEALENEYRKAGYNAVQVITPEQELTSGILRMEVRETPIAKVTITGNQHFSNENIRASLPSLQEGKHQTPRTVGKHPASQREPGQAD